MATSERKRKGGAFMSPEEVAEQLSVSAGAVRQWVRAEKMQSFRAGKLIRISQAQVDEFLASSKRAAEEGEMGKSREYTLSEIEEFVKDDALDPELAARIDKLIEERK